MSQAVIIRQAITEVTENADYLIPVFTEAPRILVQQRALVNKYETNRDIKTWSLFFLLKSVSPISSQIQNWIEQKNFLLQFSQMNENTFRRQLKKLKEMGLATVDDNYSITLTSYDKAAETLGCSSKKVSLTYNPTKNAGKQTFQYVLRCEEIRLSQERQLDGLTKNLGQQPSLKNELHYMLVKAGADDQRLYKDREYYQKRLLQLQLQAFQEGSELLKTIFTHRADINRGVHTIKKAHCYKASTSVSYMKKRMFKLGLILIKKVCVHSTDRSRLYIPDGNGKQKDGYKWISAKKSTALFLTDQILFADEPTIKKRGERKASKVA